MFENYMFKPSSAKSADKEVNRPKYSVKKSPVERNYFIKGPIDWKWICSASKCNGKALQVALAVHFLSGMQGDDTVKLPNKRMSEM